MMNLRLIMQLIQSGNFFKVLKKIIKSFRILLSNFFYITMLDLNDF